MSWCSDAPKDQHNLKLPLSALSAHRNINVSIVTVHFGWEGSFTGSNPKLFRPEGHRILAFKVLSHGISVLTLHAKVPDRVHIYS